MSLKKFVKSPAMRELIDKYFEIPKTTLGNIKAVPTTENTKLVGAAFDYILRFMITRLNENKVVSRPWVSESKPAEFDYPKGLKNKIDSYLAAARKQLDQYLQTGRITEDLLESSLHLALIDVVYRTEDVSIDIDHIGRYEIDDLRQLVSITEPQIFRAESISFLNPTFGIGSFLVGGADADLIIDDTLIDIKTIQARRISPDDVRQLIGYYILTRIGTINGSKKKHELTKLGVYSSRHGMLQTFSISSIAKEADLTDFAIEFIQRAIEVRLGIFYFVKQRNDLINDVIEPKEQRHFIGRSIASSERLAKKLSFGRPYPHSFYTKYQRLLLQTPKATSDNYLALIEEMQKNRIGKK